MMRWMVLLLVCLLVGGCPQPTPDMTADPNTSDNSGSDGTDDGADSSDEGASSGALRVGADALEQAAASVLVARVEDIRRIGGNAKQRGSSQSILDLFNGPCFNGGTRSTDPDGTMQFQGCEIFPGLELNGGVRIVPSPTGQGGRIDFFDLQGRSGDIDFRVDGSIEEIDEPDGGLTFQFDLRSSTDDGEYNDEFNVNGEIFVDGEDRTFGNLRIDTGDDFDALKPSNCQFDGQDLFAIAGDPSSFERLCPDEEFEPLAEAPLDFDDDPAGLALADALLPEIGADEKFRELLDPSRVTPNSLFGMQFDNARAYVQLDAVNVNVVGVSVENNDGQYLYTLEPRYRGWTMTLGTGDVMSVDVTEKGAISAEILLNSTSPPSTISLRIDENGNEFINASRTQIFPDPNPAYGLKPAGAPAKGSQRAAGIRLNRSTCKSIIGPIRSLGSAACDIKDLVTGELIDKIAEGLCVAAKRSLAWSGVTVETGGRSIGAANLSFTVVCTATRAIGRGAELAAKLTPAELLCKLLTLASELSQVTAGAELEDGLCNFLTQGDWFPDRIEVVGFINADGSTEADDGVLPDLNVLPFGSDPAHPTFEWSPLLVDRADWVTLTAESPGGQQDLLYWLARGDRAISGEIPYGQYSKGIKGVSNVPYPAPPLEALPEDWFYRLKVRLDDNTILENRFRIVDPRQGVIDGTIVESLGLRQTIFGERDETQPVPNVSVSVLSERGSLLGRATADDKGEFRIEKLVQGEMVTVRAEATGYAAVQQKLLVREFTNTVVRMTISPLNPACSSSGLVTPTRGAVRMRRHIDALLSDDGEGIGSGAYLICVSGTQQKVSVNWNQSWVADHMRGVDPGHLADVTDLELRVVGVSLRNKTTGAFVTQAVNFNGLGAAAVLELPEDRQVLISGHDYVVGLDLFIGSRIVLTTEPILDFTAN